MPGHQVFMPLIIANSDLTAANVWDRPFPKSFVRDLMNTANKGRVIHTTSFQTWLKIFKIEDSCVFSAEQAYLLFMRSRYLQIHRWRSISAFMVWVTKNNDRALFESLVLALASKQNEPLHPIHGSQVLSWIQTKFQCQVSMKRVRRYLPTFSKQKSYRECDLLKTLTVNGFVSKLTKN